MQSEGLEIVVGADVSAAQAGFIKLKKSTTDFVNSVKGSFDKDVVRSFNDGTLSVNKMRLAVEALKENMRLATNPAQIKQYNIAIKDLETNIKKASTAGTQFGGEAGKAFRSVFSSVRQLAFILPGIGIAGILGFATSALVDLAQEFFKTGQAALKNSDIIGETGKEYQKAVSNVSELRTNIGLAKDGFLSKTAVVKQYNDTIGKTTGFVKTLDEAEQSLNKNAEAYIKFTLLKAAANVAQGKAAEEAFKQAAQGQKDIERLQKDFPVKAKGRVELSATTAGEGEAPTLLKRTLAEQQKVKEISDKRIKSLEDIANDFQTQAALIASKFKFNFFEDNDVSKAKKTQDDVVANARAFVKQFGAVFVTPDLEESFTNTKDKILASAKKLLSDIKLGELKIKLPVQIEPELIFNPDDIKPPSDKDLEDVRKRFQDEINSRQEPFIFDPSIQIAVNNEKISADAKKKAEDLANSMKQIFANAFQSFGEDLGNAFTGGKNLFAGLFEIIGSGVEALGKQIIALGVAALNLKKALATLLANPTLAIAAGIALTAIGVGMKNISKGGVRGFAEGGIVSSPTLAMIGEGAGTRNSNPEIVAPLNKLKNILGETGGTKVEGEFVLRGENLVASIANTSRRQGRSF